MTSTPANRIVLAHLVAAQDTIRSFGVHASIESTCHEAADRYTFAIVVAGEPVYLLTISGGEVKGEWQLDTMRAMGLGTVAERVRT